MAENLGSALGAALGGMGGNASLTALYLQNPELANAIRRQQAAQPLMQQGTSYEPIQSPWQGLARAANAALGGYLMRQSDDEVQRIGGEQRARQAENDKWMADQARMFQGGAVGGAPEASMQGFERQLAGSESGGNPAIVNGQGYSGTYQFGAPRLAELGMYRPAPGEDLKANQWRGQISIPGFPNVRTQADFLANPAAQQAAYGSHMADIDRAIAGTPGAERMSANGLRAVAHLGGVEGMRRFVASGGQYSPSDANGTSLFSYYQRFSQGQPPGAPGASIGADRYVPQGNPLDMLNMANAIRMRGARTSDPRAEALAKAWEKRAELAMAAQNQRVQWAREDQTRVPGTIQVQGPNGPEIREHTPQGLGRSLGRPPEADLGGVQQSAITELMPKVMNGTATREEINRFRVAADLKTREQINAAGQVIPGLPLTPDEKAALDRVNAAQPGHPRLGNAPAPQQRPPEPTSTGSVRMTGPVPAVPEKVMGGMLENAAAVKKIDQTLAELDARKNTNSIGWTAATPAWVKDRLDPEGVRLRALIADVGSLKIHDRSGAAVTASEFSRLRRFVPAVTDPPEVIRDKLASFREEYRQIMHDSYRSFGPEAGGRAVPVIEEALGRGAVPLGGSFPAPPADAVDMLRASPGLARQFDEKYGPGAAERALGVRR